MERAIDNVQAMVPALLFLCAGVPLAALLDELGLFDALAVEIERRWDPVPVGALWILAAVTTAVLNLDTTVVLLTPLAIRLARRSGADPLTVAAVPLLLASLASSFLPVSNLTTLIAVERFDLSVGDVVGHLAVPSFVACAVGWWCYRRRFPTVLRSSAPGERDLRALRIGGSVVAALLIGFVIGPSVGIDPWVIAVAADAVLVAVTRTLPIRQVPILTALGVAIVAALISLVLPADLLTGVVTATAPAALGATVLAAAAAANAVNNLPALLVTLDGTDHMTPGIWAWLAGVNVGAALLPVGALANLLWWRIVRSEGVKVDLRSYLRLTVPVAVPALVAAAVTIVALGALARI